jgi:hypothetical protein
MCLDGGMPITGATFGNPTYSSAIGPTLSGAPMGKMGPLLSFGQTYALGSAFSGLAKGLASFKTGSAQKESLVLQAQVQQANSEMIAEQMKNEKSASKKERDAIRRKYRKLGKGIVTDTAANNILLGGGSPLDALLGVEIYETADMGTAKVNEASRVFGMKIQKFNADAQGDILRASAARINPAFDAATTMLSSATSSAFNYYNYKQSRITGLSTIRSALGIT